LAEKALGVLVDKLTMSQKRTFAAKATTSLLRGCSKSTASQSRNMISPVGTCEITSGLLQPVLGCPAEERHCITRESPVKGHQYD